MNKEEITPYSEINSAPVVQLFLNNKWYNDLDKFLKNIEWDVFGDEILEPKKVRKFAKGIEDEEVRLDVIKFLQMYAKQYFREAAEKAEYNERVTKTVGIPFVEIHIKTPDERILLFQQELLFLIDQLENNGQFSGDKFAKLQKRNEQLEKQVQELVDKVAHLETQLDKYKHPSDYGKHIPKELDNEEFRNIMGHLAVEGIVRTVSQPDSNGYYEVVCYQWDASMALFGYFVEKMNDAMNLRGARVPLKWKVFEPAINNYDEIINEARKSLSTYNNSSTLQKNRIEKADKIDDAIARKNESWQPF